MELKGFPYKPLLKDSTVLHSNKVNNSTVQFMKYLQDAYLRVYGR